MTDRQKIIDVIIKKVWQRLNNVLRVHSPILLNWSVLEIIFSREFIRNMSPGQFHAHIFLALFFDFMQCYFYAGTSCAQKVRWSIWFQQTISLYIWFCVRVCVEGGACIMKTIFCVFHFPFELNILMLCFCISGQWLSSHVKLTFLWI